MLRPVGGISATSLAVSVKKPKTAAALPVRVAARLGVAMYRRGQACTAEELPRLTKSSWTQVIKEQLDKRLGAPWHVVAGQHYAYEVTHECRNLMHLFIGGKMGVLVWKT